MRSTSRVACPWTKWALFVAFLFTVPVPYFMVVVGGLVPLFFILVQSVRGLVVAVPKFTAEGFWMIAILWAHVVILGGILYVAARAIHWILFRVLPQRLAKFLVFALIAALVLLAAFFEVYRVPGHDYAPPANIFRFMKEIAT